MQALYYTRWFTKASISRQKKRTKQQQQQTNKQTNPTPTDASECCWRQKANKRNTRSYGVQSSEQGHRGGERERREIKRRICERERERERERYIARAQRRIQNMFRQKTEKEI
jgi:hypothetical protein